MLSTDPFAALSCAKTVSIWESLFSRVPDGACVNISMSPFTIFLCLIALGGVIALIQTFVRAALFGRPDKRPSLANRLDVDGPELSVREAANRARARRINSA